ncbi:MAG TPA: redox-sensing transcriptional repressor Rex, partial [Bacillota bacterium]|nr:redox-sensing transcriptional repressor Rex [Bacillota bacterium]
MSYGGFAEYGLDIAAAFDSDPAKPSVASKPVFPMEKLSANVREINAVIGIITVPAPYAQEACDELVECGVKAIWNFAPAHLTAPKHILIKNENMAASLAVLSQHLTPDDKEDI